MSADLHHDTLEIFDRFVAAHGRKPSLHAADPTERSLAVWFGRVMTNLDRGGRSQWRRTFELVQQMKQFEEANQRMPVRSSADETEATLARWGKTHLDNDHPHPVIRQLATKHRWNVKPTQRRVAELTSFVEAHGRLPRPRGGTQSEQSLLYWIVARLERGTLPAEAQRIIDAGGGGGYESLLLRRKVMANRRAR